jgi:hypothetical protein
MLFLMKWFGVTGSDAERNLAEQDHIEEIIEKVLLVQKNAAAKQQRPLGRGTHAKGVTARAQFELFDVTVGRDRGADSLVRRETRAARADPRGPRADKTPPRALIRGARLPAREERRQRNG